MHLRKSLIAGAAVVAAGILSLGPSAWASIATVDVNGNTTAGSVNVDGPFKGGTATFAGFTATCSGGNVAGTVQRGPKTSPDFSFGTLNLSCTSFLPGTVSMSVICAPTITMDAGAAVTNAMTDVVPGTANMTTCPGGNPSIQVAVGPCSFKVGGSIGVTFDENTKSVGGVTYQDLILNGTGLTTSSASIGCFGAIPNGTGITLNNIDFNLQVTGGSAPGINYLP